MIEEIKKQLLDYFEFPNESINTEKTKKEIQKCIDRGMPVAVALEEIVWGVASLQDAEAFCIRNGWKPDQKFYNALAAHDKKFKKYRLINHGSKK